MLLTDDRIAETRRQHARDERLRTHQHLAAIRAARGPNPGPSALRRRLGASIVRLGWRVAGDVVAAPVLRPSSS